jgi:hypothetical protein
MVSAGRDSASSRSLGRGPVSGSAGYSGTPLGKKLGVKDGQSTWRFRMPESVAEEIGRSGAEPRVMATPVAGLEMAHVFVTERAELAKQLARLRRLVAPAGVVWVSWPKKTAPQKTVPKGVTAIASEVTEDVVRAEALPLGFVDIKVCAVDAVWSGLKLVVRKSER